ncbi:hypothetical protein AgCh_024690 [Apium graveolens]
MDYRSPRDKDGHGSHTAATVAGRIVPKVAALGGFAYGTASGVKPLPYDQDGLAIAGLHVVKKNIVVSASAGNSGPSSSTLSNLAPWIITVSASSMDHDRP